MTTFDLPNATTTIADISAYSAPMFTEYLPMIFMAVGLTAAAFALVWLMGLLVKFLAKVFGQRRRRGGRRGRR